MYMCVFARNTLSYTSHNKENGEPWFEANEEMYRQRFELSVLVYTENNTCLANDRNIFVFALM